MEMKTAAKKTAAFLKKYELIWFLIVVSVLALLLRVQMFDYKSGDYNSFLAKWYDHLDKNGGFKGLKTLKTDYMPTYLYFVALFTYLPWSNLTLFKLTSVLFDFVLAVFVGLTVRRLKKSDTMGMVGYTAALFLPVVFLNSAMWGQCDVIFTSFTVACFYFLLQGKEKTSMILYGIAISFKIQAIFFAPVLLIAVLKKKVHWLSLCYVVLTFLLLGVPGLFCGMPVKNVYGVYFTQMGEYPKLTYNTPNLYNWANTSSLNNSTEFLNKFAAGMTLCAVGLTALALLPLYRTKFRTDDGEIWMLMAAFFAAFLPFVLPHMHERYWFLSDIFALIFLLNNPKKWYISAALTLPSLYVICAYLFKISILSLGIWSIMLFAGTAMIAYELYRGVKERMIVEEDSAEKNEK